MKIILTLSLLSFTLSLPCFALQVKGIEFEDQIQWEQTRLELNGVGVRKATLFKVKVYLAGLYLEAKSQDPELILNSKNRKKVSMVFLRNVDADDVQEAWRKSLKKNCEDLFLNGETCLELQPKIDEFVAWMKTMKENEKIEYFFESDAVSARINNQEVGKLNHPHFPRLVLATWLGKFPPNEDLKEGMLGRVRE